MKQLIGIVMGFALMSSNANALDIGVSVKAGTLGAGVDLSIALTQTINARIGLTSVEIDSEQETLSVGDPGFSLSIEPGVALLDPQAQLQASVITGGNFNNQAELDAMLRDAENNFESELDEFEIFPVFSIGINYAF